MNRVSTSGGYSSVLSNLMSAQQRQAEAIWLEAESVQVGRCRIPAGLWRQMKAAPALEICRPLAELIERLVKVYGALGQEPLRVRFAEGVINLCRRVVPCAS